MILVFGFASFNLTFTFLRIAVTGGFFANVAGRGLNVDFSMAEFSTITIVGTFTAVIAHIVGKGTSATVIITSVAGFQSAIVGVTIIFFNHIFSLVVVLV